MGSNNNEEIKNIVINRNKAIAAYNEAREVLHALTVDLASRAMPFAVDDIIDVSAHYSRTPKVRVVAIDYDLEERIPFSAVRVQVIRKDGNLSERFMRIFIHTGRANDLASAKVIGKVVDEKVQWFDQPQGE